MTDGLGGRAFPICGALLSFAVLVLCGCGSKSADGSASNTPPNGLLLQAFGGDSGEVAAQVPLLDPNVGPQMTCSAPVNAGDCRLNSCRLGGIGSPGSGGGNFGPISATVGATTVPITYDGTGYPTVYFPSSVTLGEGGTMTFRGGNQSGVPAFDVSVVIPGLAVLTSPVATPDGGVTTISTSGDLPVTWSPISIGQIQFQIEGGDNDIGGMAISIACTFDGASGSGLVPATLISSMKEMVGTTSTYAYLTSQLDATTVVDGLTIETQGYQNSSTAEHAFAVTLQ
jgi:hypothetical protein